LNWRRRGVGFGFERFEQLGRKAQIFERHSMQA